MTQFKTLLDASNDVIEDIKRVGLCEALGVEELPPGRRVDPSLCMCGGGCESPLECEFWYYVRKTDAMERRAHRQVQIGRFRVDSLFDCDGKFVVVELDGKEFHDAKKDMHRDDELLATVDAVIRIPWAAVHFYPHATFCVLSQWYQRFALRGIDLFCVHISELNHEIESCVDGDGLRVTADRWLVDRDSNYEVWSANDGSGFVGSPKGWIKRWSIPRIQHRVAGPRWRERPPVRVECIEKWRPQA